MKIFELYEKQIKKPPNLPPKRYPQHYFPPCETSKTTRKKLKISKYLNKKTFKIHMKKGTYLISSLVKTSHKIFEDPQNGKKEIENFITSKYQNKRPSKFLEENQIPYLSPCETSHTKIKDLQNDKRKIRKQKPFKVHMKKGTYLIFSLVKLHTILFWKPPKWQEEN